MYFKLNNKLLTINTYNKFNLVIKSIIKPYTYILINDKHYKNINYERFKNLPEINEININYKLQGGFIDVIVETLISIYKIIILIPKIIIWVIQFIIWLVRLAFFLIKSIFTLLQSGIRNTINSIIILIIYTPLNLISKLIKSIFGDGIKKDKSTDANYKCYGVEDDGTVPTSILISTILCPPLGVFMMYGITGWLSIITSAILSLFYYIPGLLYALMQIYTQ
jgi:uncharacterized membrane protein YqaE (UPF0057 family)